MISIEVKKQIVLKAFYLYIFFALFCWFQFFVEKLNLQNFCLCDIIVSTSLFIVVIFLSEVLAFVLIYVVEPFYAQILFKEYIGSFNANFKVSIELPYQLYKIVLLVQALFQCYFFLIFLLINFVLPINLLTKRLKLSFDLQINNHQNFILHYIIFIIIHLRQDFIKFYFILIYFHLKFYYFVKC